MKIIQNFIYKIRCAFSLARAATILANRGLYKEAAELYK
jgi:hypothetical protein